jgi:hypothetical protein
VSRDEVLGEREPDAAQAARDDVHAALTEPRRRARVRERHREKAPYEARLPTQRHDVGGVGRELVDEGAGELEWALQRRAVDVDRPNVEPGDLAREHARRGDEHRALGVALGLPTDLERVLRRHDEPERASFEPAERLAEREQRREAVARAVLPREHRVEPDERRRARVFGGARFAPRASRSPQLGEHVVQIALEVLATGRERAPQPSGIARVEAELAERRPERLAVRAASQDHDGVWRVAGSPWGPGRERPPLEG